MNSGTSRRGFLSGAGAPVAAQAVPKAKLGRTGLEITRLIFGSMVASDLAVIQQAEDLGINCFATARDYQNGNNERLLGAALKGRRERVVLLTESIDMMWRDKSEKETKAYVLNNLEKSLRELQTDYIDVFFLHHKDEPGWVPDEAVEALEVAKRQGKIRHAGLTTHGLPKMVDYLRQRPVFEAVISIFNFTLGAEEQAAVRQVREMGVGLIAMKVMAGGTKAKDAPAALKRPGGTKAALKWALSQAGVDAVVTSISDEVQLAENLAATREPFGGEERLLLAEALKEMGPRHCRMCGQCAGTCAQGLPVAEVLRCGMYAEGYGEFAMGRARFLQLPQVARSGACGRCEECTVRCRFGVRVEERVERVRRLLA